MTMVRPGGDGGGDHAQELDLLLRGGRGAEPVAGLEIGDGLAGDGERGADHAGDRHHEEHPGGAGDAETQAAPREEMMMVSMVMPETGLRAVVAMALAATEVKKNEKTSVSTTPTIIATGEPSRLPRKSADRDGAEDDADQHGHDGHVAVGALAVAASPRRKALQRDAEGSRDDAHGFQDAEDAGGGDGADADEAHIAAEDLRGGHLGDGMVAGIDRGGVVAADHPDQRDQHEVGEHAAGAEDHGTA